MKLFNQFNILPRYLTAFNYAELNLDETSNNLRNVLPNFKTFGIKNLENIQPIKIFFKCFIRDFRKIIALICFFFLIFHNFIMGINLPCFPKYNLN